MVKVALHQYPELEYANVYKNKKLLYCQFGDVMGDMRYYDGNSEWVGNESLYKLAKKGFGKDDNNKRIVSDYVVMEHCHHCQNNTQSQHKTSWGYCLNCIHLIDYILNI